MAQHLWCGIALGFELVPEGEALRGLWRRARLGWASPSGAAFGGTVCEIITCSMQRTCGTRGLLTILLTHVRTEGVHQILFCF